MSEFSSWLIENWHVVIIGCILLAIVIACWKKFLVPSKLLGKELTTAINQLKGISNQLQGIPITDIDQIATKCMTTERLSHLWREFAETLHPQKMPNEYGQEKVVRWRASAMAEAFFTEQVLVDTPLKTEFYKHVPGILTGLGIIGTFSGLIQGLARFEVSGDADVARASLAALIQSVGHAFFVSAIAIVLAMLFTGIEKHITTARYRQVEDLCQLLDSLFDAGAGEEYLCRLVQASETSATQAMQIKDSLVTDLKQILAEMTVQQIQASTHNSQQASQVLAESFAETMRAPMERITIAVDQVSSKQGDAVNKMLTDVLASFTSQIQELFGGQLQGMSDLLVQTNQSMLGTVSQLNQLATNLQSAGEGAANSMAVRLQEALLAMEARQTAMTEQMRLFLEQAQTASCNVQDQTAEKMQSIMAELGEKVMLLTGHLDAQAKTAAGNHENQVLRLSQQIEDFIVGMREMLGNTQTETSQKLHDAIEIMGTKVSDMVGMLENQTKVTTEAHNDNLLQVAERVESFFVTVQDAAHDAQQQTAQVNQLLIAELGQQVKQTIVELHDLFKHTESSSTARQHELAAQTSRLLTSLSSQVEGLGEKVANAAMLTQQSVTSLAVTSQSAIDRMNSGADSLLVASGELSDAEKRVAATMGAMTTIAQNLQASSASLSNVSQRTQQVFEDHKMVVGTFSQIVANLRDIVENASREVGVTTTLVGRMEGAAKQLNVAQQAADQYLQGVTEVLGKAHEEFAKNIEKNLRLSNSQFHHELSQAVQLLGGAIQDLGDTLEARPTQKA